MVGCGGICETTGGAAICQERTDKPLALFVGTEALVAVGYRAVRVRTGKEALACLASTTPAVLVVAVHLPDMSGMELLRQIRAEEWPAGMEVIVTGAHPSPA